jgi:hypothetical protein
MLLIMTEKIAISQIDPFAGLEDEVDPGPTGQLTALLASTKRGFTPYRKVLVQQPNTEEIRAAALAAFVTGRHHRPLDALLLAHALQPILPGTPLSRRTWARLMSTRKECSDATAEKTFQTLVDMKLIKVEGSPKAYEVTPLMENQSGDAWVKAGAVKEEGPGYFTLPTAYWTMGLMDRLTLPGKALLLIALAETQDPTKPRFAMAVERAPAYYGISERTAERGYNELHRAGLLLVKRQKVADPKHPAGRRDVYWRALASPFSTYDRASLQSESKTRTRKALESAD